MKTTFYALIGWALLYLALAGIISLLFRPKIKDNSAQEFVLKKRVLTENTLRNDKERIQYANQQGMGHCITAQNDGSRCPCGQDPDKPCNWYNHCLIHFAIGDSTGCGCDTMLRNYKDMGLAAFQTPYKQISKSTKSINMKKIKDIQ